MCHNGVVFCDNQPCPVKRGIPASISRDEEIRRRSHERYISIDDEEVTEDASGSIDFGSGVEVYKERQNEGDTGLGKKDGGRENGSRGDDDKREQEFDDFSEDGNQKHLREVRKCVTVTHRTVRKRLWRHEWRLTVTLRVTLILRLALGSRCSHHLTGFIIIFLFKSDKW